MRKYPGEYNVVVRVKEETPETRDFSLELIDELQEKGVNVIKYLDKITSLFFNYLLLVILRSAAKPVPSLRSRTSSKLAAGKNLMP